MTPLYYKPGVAGPQDLAGVTETDGAGLPWSDLANNPNGRAACGWIAAPEPPAHDPAAERVVGTVDGWAVEALPPPPAPAPMRIGKYWLFERFTEGQERQVAILEAQRAALTPEQLADPAFEGLFQFGRFMRRLDALDVIELDAAGTLAGFELMRLLGVFGDPEDPASTAARNLILLTPPTAQEWDGI